MKRVAVVAVVMLSALAPLGCRAPGPVVVPAPPLLALTRDHYVLPPEPPAPRPTWDDDEARRALEAEWPPVDALSIPPPPPPDGPRLIRPQPRLGPPRPRIAPPPDRRPLVQGAARVERVILRASPPGGRAASRVVLILEPR